MTLESLLSVRAPGAASPGVTINTLVVSQSAHGARIKTYAPKYANVPARITDPDSNNQTFFERNGLQISHVVYLGGQSGRIIKLSISQGDQVVFGSRIFEIQGVRNPDQEHRYYIIGCLEKTPGLVTGFP